jgi:sialate O-acetylesterase
MVSSQENPQKMPREDVVHVPAVGKGLCVSNVFQSQMVLQRNKPIDVWGWAEPGEKVTVTFAEQMVETTAGADRSWKISLEPMPASGTPQVMTVKGNHETLQLEEILVGDVWILGGQSNMEFELSKVDDGALEIVSANFPQIRMLTMPQGKGFDSVKSFERLHEWSSWSSRHFRKGDWDVCSPETVREFSAIGYVFGRRLHMATQVPIGLIDASIGGTTVETWTPQEMLREIEGQETKDKLKEWEDKIATYDAQADLQQRIDNYERQQQRLAEQGKSLPANSQPPSDLRPGPVADRNRPGYCYAGVIRPLEGLAIKGAVFHQGFNNCFDGSAGARMYYQIFGKMITAWRSAFNDAQLPFCIISLCTAGEPQTLEDYLIRMYDVGVYIREAQYKTFRDFYDAGDQGIGFVSCFDLRKSWYHPQIKIPAGERAAKWALVTQYELLTGGDAQQYWLPPSIKTVKVIDGTIRLTMSTDIKTRDDSDGRLLGFAIAGENRRFYPADIQWYTDGSVDNRNQPKYQRDVLVLSSPFVPKPVHFRHAWARNPMSNIVNDRGVSLATQRSDEWLLEETPIQIPLPPNTDLKSQGRRIRGLLMKELELADTERQLQKAEAVIAELKPILEKAQADSQKKQ